MSPSDEADGAADLRARRDAVRLLSRRARTVGEIRAALARRHAPAVVESAVDSLCSEGLLDDRRTAREWLTWRRDHDPLGRMRLEHELRRRRLRPDDVDGALEEYYREGTEGDDLARALDRMLGGRRPPADPATLRRMAGRLERRGFRGGDAVEALRARRGEDGPWADEG